MTISRRLVGDLIQQMQNQEYTLQRTIYLNSRLTEILSYLTNLYEIKRHSLIRLSINLLIHTDDIDIEKYCLYDDEIEENSKTHKISIMLSRDLLDGMEKIQTEYGVDLQQLYRVSIYYLFDVIKDIPDFTEKKETKDLEAQIIKKAENKMNNLKQSIKKELLDEIRNDLQEDGDRNLAPMIRNKLQQDVDRYIYLLQTQAHNNPFFP